MDVELSSDPFRFDGFRFNKLRRKATEGVDTANIQRAIAGLGNMHFTYGWISCPGRQFASAEIKIIAIELIRRYELGPLSGP